MSSQQSGAGPIRVRRWLRGLGLGLVLVFLAANGAARVQALEMQAAPLGVVLLTVAVAGAALVATRSFAAPALELFGASFLMFGFHSYRPQNQAFELVASGLAAGLCLRIALRTASGTPEPARPAVARVLAPALGFALLAGLSLLLLPAPVIEHRLFLEGDRFASTLVGAFPKDPLYPLTSVARLWLLALVAALLAAQRDARELYRRLFRGVAWSAIAAAILGLLDFAGVLSLAGYNLSHLFYGARYRRLQSTFSNPSWFASFVVCALPFVLLVFHEARRRARLALALVFAPCAASLFLSGARAAWLASASLAAALAAVSLLARRRGRPLEPDAAVWLALGSTLLALVLLVATAAGVPAAGDPDLPPGRLEGLSREMQQRGVGLRSPRSVVAEYAMELAKLRPLTGLAHESFNIHLRAQLAIPGTAVSRVVNSAVLADSRETVFDDSHNTYLQVLTGTGALGLALWLAVSVAGLASALRALRTGGSPEALAVLLGLGLFHFYGLFQGMTYIPVTLFLFPLLTSYACVLDPGRAEPPRSSAGLRAAIALALLAALASYASDTGFASLKRRFGVAAYLPEESEEFEGFYRPETGPHGEFRWMGRRGIVNVRKAEPFRLLFVCGHPDLEREPVVVTLSFEAAELEKVVCRRPGVVERRFATGAPGALRLSVSRTFEPGGGDRRELGIAISAIRWE